MGSGDQNPPGSWVLASENTNSSSLVHKEPSLPGELWELPENGWVKTSSLLPQCGLNYKPQAPVTSAPLPEPKVSHFPLLGQPAVLSRHSRPREGQDVQIH